MSYNWLILLLFLGVGCSEVPQSNANRRVFIFDKMIEEEDVEIELYNRISNAKKRVYLKNFPALDIKHSKNDPDLFIDLLSKMKKKGVDIKVIHISKKGMYPLTKHLYLNGIKDIEQHNESYSYGVIGQGAKYAIIDEEVFVIHDPDDYPRIIGLEVEKKEIKEDFQYTWEYALKNKNSRF